MLMMGVNIHSQQQLRKEYGVGEGISIDIQIIKDSYT